MLTRVMILIVLLTVACTPNPVRSSAPPQATSENIEKSTDPAVITPLSSPVVAKETSESSVVTPLPSLVVKDELQKKLTRVAMEDLAARLGTNTAGISVMSVKATVWPDAALGCPLSDQVYASGKVHGFQIRLKAGGQVYVYHTDVVSQVVFCPETKPPEPGLR